MAGWVLQHALPFVVTEANLKGPFPLRHMDMHYKNIFVDDQYNITGIIDWTHAQTVPMELFAVVPELATGPGVTAELKAKASAFLELFLVNLRKIEVEHNEQAVCGGGCVPERTLSAKFSSGGAVGSSKRQKSNKLSSGKASSQMGCVGEARDDRSYSNLISCPGADRGQGCRSSDAQFQRQRLSDLVANPRTDLVGRCFGSRVTTAKWMARLAASLLFGDDGQRLTGGIAWRQLEHSYEAAKIS